MAARGIVAAALGIVLIVAACATTPTPSSPSPVADPSRAGSAAWMDPTLAPEARAAALLAVDDPRREDRPDDPAGAGVRGSGGRRGDATGIRPERWRRRASPERRGGLVRDGRRPTRTAALGTRLGDPDAVRGGCRPRPQQRRGRHDVPAERRSRRGRRTRPSSSGSARRRRTRWPRRGSAGTSGRSWPCPRMCVGAGRTKGSAKTRRWSARLSAAFIHGLQGSDLTNDDAAAATAKHFLGDGGTTFGSSTTDDYLLDQGVNPADDATLRAIHLPPYQSAIDAGARIVMASFSSTTAGKVHADHHLLTDVLKGELGFSGFVVSDWAAVDQIDPDYPAAVGRAIEAGIDMVMVPYDGPRFQDAVRADLASGAIHQSRIDDAVLRILRVKFEMGLFEHPLPPAGRWADVGSEAHRAIARQAVAGSLVLLKTSLGALPIRPNETGPPRRTRGGRHRPAIGWVDHLVAGQPGRHHPGHHHRRSVDRPSRRSTGVPRDPCRAGRCARGRRHRGAGRGSVCRGRGRFSDARDRRTGGHRAGAAQGGSTDRDRALGAARHPR